MNTVKSENILKVIENFKKVLPMATLHNHLNMQCCEVNHNHICGTTHCHAGWYMVAVMPTRTDKTFSFSDGCLKMATRLGFRDSINSGPDDKLENWAETNCGLWGNPYGNQMFSDEAAFYHETKRPEGAKNLQHIIDHWTEVYERVRALEESSQMLSRVGAVQVSDTTVDAQRAGSWPNKTKSFTNLIPVVSEVQDSITTKESVK